MIFWNLPAFEVESDEVGFKGVSETSSSSESDP